MATRNPSLVSIAVLALAACGGGTSVYLHTPEIAATVQLGKVTHPKWADVVWGRLTIEGMSRLLKSADLDCFTLRIGDSVSDNTYVSSIASVSTREYSAREGKVIVPVYWTMKDFAAGTTADLARAQVAIESPRTDPCFEFE